MLVASSNTELELQCSSDNFILRLFLTFRPIFYCRSTCSQVWTTDGHQHRCVSLLEGFLPPRDCVVQLIEFGTAAAGHQLESHRAECKNQ